jgi:hypothetical protein
VSKILIAFVAQLGERMTEDHKVRGSIPRGGTFFIYITHSLMTFLIYNKDYKIFII